jgi:hypothetical protein
MRMTVALDAKHWLQRASQARTTAEWMADPDARRILIEIAERYEQLAKMPAAYRLEPFVGSKEDECPSILKARSAPPT